MAIYWYKINRCDGGAGMNSCVIRHEFNVATARAFVAASKLADAIPGAFVRSGLNEGAPVFHVVPEPVRIEAPAIDPARGQAAPLDALPEPTPFRIVECFAGRASLGFLRYADANGLALTRDPHDAQQWRAGEPVALAWERALMVVPGVTRVVVHPAPAPGVA